MRALVTFVSYVALVLGLPGYLLLQQASGVVDTPNCIAGQTVVLEAHPFGARGVVPIDDGVTYRWTSRNVAVARVNKVEGKYTTVTCKAEGQTEVRVYFDRAGQPQKVGGYIVTVAPAPVVLGVSVTVETEYKAGDI